MRKRRQFSTPASGSTANLFGTPTHRTIADGRGLRFNGPMWRSSIAVFLCVLAGEAVAACAIKAVPATALRPDAVSAGPISARHAAAHPQRDARRKKLQTLRRPPQILVRRLGTLERMRGKPSDGTTERARPHPPAKDHPRRDARSRHSRAPGLLLGLPVQPSHSDQRRSMAG